MITNKPVLIIQHTEVAQPGAILTVLDQLQIPWQLLSLERGDPYPQHLEKWSGLVLLGGAMSANDSLDWIQHELTLIRQADELGLPILGHCLGAQLLSKALGGQVYASPQTEIGWQDIHVENPALSMEWFGVRGLTVPVFQWHREMFSLPKHTQLLFSSQACPHQAYVLANKHMAVQFHLEVTPEIIQRFLVNSANYLKQQQAMGNAFVSTRAEIEQGIASHLAASHQMLFHLYQRWVQGLQH